MRRFLTPRWLALHGLTVVLFLVFLRLGWWQFGRGEAGNELSWGYAAEWPFFACCIVFMWYKMIEADRHPEDEHEASSAQAGPKPAVDNISAPAADGASVNRTAEHGAEPDPPVADGTSSTGPGPDGGERHPSLPPPRRVVPHYAPEDETDPELAAYNAYLTRLNAGRR